MKYFIYMFVLSACIVTSPRQAFAYSLDPGTGTYILQFLITAFVGALLAIKIFWIKIKILFNKIFSSSKDSNK